MSASCRGHKWCMCQICCTRVSISVQSICNLAIGNCRCGGSLCISNVVNATQKVICLLGSVQSTCDVGLWVANYIFANIL